MNDRDQVLKAAAELVAAFAANDREAYFGAFSADASFVFYTLEQPLLSRDAYQAVWDSWRSQDGFEVLSCTSSNAFVSLQGDVAIFIHDVATELRMQGELLFSQERETIVFRKQQEQGQWLACHEHLSATPQGLPSP
ncbi:YybH family protein [Pseudomonas gingeri]|uniref:Nuclear transport factor 2 family protein n=1 Tax=Pseudomonas gingeri TaxID=117681 RepID=A0A7Y7YEX5_9PSED|nr:nuclear transport factor 2 family protein [Pseudomonas gingeri]NWA00847.1 nuclear transport factor 2 family protein [Pseudomonas gingeri]NWA16109.1 nuclear transport factor 2 family protein [Pseudomonas gingeri]NWA54299.1 nuclear transport factor 2 family protein [Pseudomonas gingeri]NWA97624.1 nuclear transport factor 2 family protein [Pseudomonas gingeri]NWB04430.1 nuclear transport factor 2 family protein [Pseudomonas gingeri]